MALLHSTASVLGSSAQEFSLPGVDGKTYSLDSFKSHKGLLIIFMCNHCPYVIAVQERINQLAKEFAPQGIAVLAISSNDPLYKIEDSFENMKLYAQKNHFSFPYVFDESQNVARAYDAVCTPDPYLFENISTIGAAEFVLRYRGRIDDAWKDESQVKEQSLRNAMSNLIAGKLPNTDQAPSMGCSIKWKELTGKK